MFFRFRLYQQPLTTKNDTINDEIGDIMDIDLPPVFDIPLPAFKLTELELYIRSRRRAAYLKTRKLLISKFTPVYIAVLRVIEKGIRIERLDFLSPYIKKVRARLRTVDQGVLQRNLERFSKKESLIR